MNLISILFFVLFNATPEVVEIDKIRMLFEQAVFEKSKAVELMNYSELNNSIPLAMGYCGAAKMLLAKFEYNIFTKYEYFTKGKRDLEAAIRLDPECVELRFLRFSCQSQSPWFLNYKCSLDTDKEMLIHSLVQNESLNSRVRTNIVKVLKDSDYCTKSERKLLMLLK